MQTIFLGSMGARRRTSLVAADLPVSRHSLQGGALISLIQDRKSTRLNSSHVATSYAVFCLKKKKGRPTRATAAPWLLLGREGPRGALPGSPYGVLYRAGRGTRVRPVPPCRPGRRRLWILAR